MRVLGLDPGTAITGYGVVFDTPEGLRAETYGVIRTPADMPLPIRLLRIHEQLRALIDQYAPDIMVAEELFFNTNVRTAFAVGQARGVCLMTGAQAGLPIVEYTPLQVKQALTGYGRASKDQVQQMVRLVLRLTAAPSPDDAADALAVAVCHHHSARMISLAGDSAIT